MNGLESHKKIEKLLQDFRPKIQADGGDIEFIKFENGIVYVKMHGACVGCPASFFTLKFAIEDTLKQHIPEIIEVISVE
jgi:Fe-S cluster biogenesis protein NfuA